MGQLVRGLGARATALLLICSACSVESAPPRSAPTSASPLNTLSYDFAVHSVGITSSPDPLVSRAQGRLELTILDDPPLLVGSLEVGQMRLGPRDAPLASAQPGRWPLVARRTAEGLVDAVWLAPDMLPSTQSLARFLLSQVSRRHIGTHGSEHTNTGVVEARYHDVSLPAGRLTLRTRSPASSGAHSGWGLFASDRLGHRWLIALEMTRNELGGQAELGSLTMLSLRRKGVLPLGRSHELELRAHIESLSRAAPSPLVEQRLSEAAKDVLRRGAEDWPAAHQRLLAVHERADPQLIGRAAAHLRDDDAHVEELMATLDDHDIPELARRSMLAALGESGTPACQEALISMLERGDKSIEAEILAALSRVSEPTLASVTTLLKHARADEGAELRATTGIMLARLASSEPELAQRLLAPLLQTLADCPPELDEWFMLLGNAGLSTSATALLACLDAKIPLHRRASAVEALRRIPGEALSARLLELAADDPNLRLASLRALGARELEDAQLAQLRPIQPHSWSKAEQGALLDLLERISAPGPTTRALIVKGQEFEDGELALRAADLAQRLPQ